MPPLPVTPLIASILGHLQYARPDSSAGKCEVNLLVEPSIYRCMRWVTAKAGAGPSCSILSRSVGGKKMSFIPEFFMFMINREGGSAGIMLQVYKQCRCGNMASHEYLHQTHTQQSPSQADRKML